MVGYVTSRNAFQLGALDGDGSDDAGEIPHEDKNELHDAALSRFQDDDSPKIVMEVKGGKAIKIDIPKT